MKQSLAIILIACIFFIGCSKQEPSNGVYVLMAMSGAHIHGLEKNRAIINHLLKNLQYNDTLVVARIDTDGFNEKDIIAGMTFDYRPSVTNYQKMIFHQEVNYFFKNAQVNKNRDLTGGILQAAQYLKQIGPDNKYLLIFSDFKEKPKKKSDRNMGFQFQGIRVAVIKDQEPGIESLDTQQYMKDVEEWRNRVHSGFGKWQLVDRFDRLENIFNERYWE